jgi:tryptophan synthase alpha chain
VAAVSDAVVIGSALVQLLESQSPETAAATAERFIGDIRAALDTLSGGHP